VISSKVKPGQKVLVRYYVPGGMELQLLSGIFKKYEDDVTYVDGHNDCYVQIGSNEVIVKNRDIFSSVKSFLLDRVSTCDHHEKEYKCKKELYKRLLREKNYGKNGKWLRFE
jgi:hypothetical protein